MMRQRQRQQHRIDMEGEEELARRQAPCLTRQLHAPRRRQAAVLHLSLIRPRRSGRDHESPAWMRSSFLYVYVGGEHITSLELPFKGKDIKEWKHSMTYPMDAGWRGLSVGIEAVRRDFFVLRTGRVVPFRTKEPHTSGQTAVIGTVRVPLLDALVLGDEDDDDSGEEENKKKRRRDDEEGEAKKRLAEGTREFDERVELQTWRWEVGREPTNVVCGTLGVHMYITGDC